MKYRPLAIMRFQIYYAHAMCIYKTKFEKAEKKLIRKHLPNCLIVDPGSFQNNEEKSKQGMNYCFDLIDNCNALAFTRLLGKVTSGVGLEIRHALRKGIPVFEVEDGSIKQITRPIKYLSRKATRNHYRLWELANRWQLMSQLFAARRIYSKTRRLERISCLVL
jgi:hypothetical protein